MLSDTRRDWLLYLVLLTVTVLLGGYVLGWPLASLLAEPVISPRGIRLNETVLLDQVRMRLFEAVIAFWFFAFGASLGSFLNVVVYRTPRGRSLLGSSFCPKCSRPIRWRDNLPVLGWLWLRGRCRDCGLPIAGRYPLVELLTGLMILGLAIAELFLDGANLPGQTDSSRYGVSWLIVRPRADLIATFVYHAVLLCILLSWTLIRWDGFRVPAAYILLALLFGMAMPWVFSDIHPVEWSLQLPQWLATNDRWRQMATPLAGLAFGGVAGLLHSAAASVWAGSERWRAPATVDLAIGMGLVGLCLGWQAIVSVCLLAASSRVLVSTVTGGVLMPHSGAAWLHLTAAVFLQILAWRGLDSVAGWPATNLAPHEVLVPLAASLYFVLVAAYVERRRGAG